MMSNLVLVINIYETTFNTIELKKKQGHLLYFWLESYNILNILDKYLDAWPKIPLRSFTLKNCLFGVTDIVKNSGKKSISIVIMK